MITSGSVGSSRGFQNVIAAGRSQILQRSTPVACIIKAQRPGGTKRRVSHTTTSLAWRPPDSLVHISAVGLAACLVLTSLPCSGGSVLANKPSFSSDYAAVVRKREGKSKSNLPSSREAEALLEINEDLFTTEALEGMSRYPYSLDPAAEYFRAVAC